MDRLDDVVQQLRAVAVPQQPPTPVQRRGVPRPLLIGIPALLIGIVVAFLALHRTTTEPNPGSSAQIMRPVSQWQIVMERIDANRMQAFMDDDPSWLALSEEWNSPASKTDIEIMTELRERGLRLDRNPIHIDDVSEEFAALAGDLKRVGLLVTDHMEAHNFINSDGVVVETRPARSRQTWKIELRRSAGTGRWRLFSVVRAMPQSVPGSRHET